MPQGPCLDRCAMILISTGVASEPMRADPAPAVLHWSGRRETLDLHRNAVSGAELRPGVAILPEHGRRDTLQGAVDAMVAENFVARICRSTGRPRRPSPSSLLSVALPTRVPDLRIAARVVTRDAEHFEGCGIELPYPRGSASDG